MKIATAAEMREIDRAAIEKFGIPGSVLMERAGLAVAQRVRDLCTGKKVVVLAGGGNNGGDGIAAARNLHNWGEQVRVLLMLREDKLSPGCLAQYRIAKQAGVLIDFRRELNEKDFQDVIVVDALLGTGINKPVASPMNEVITALNDSGAQIVAVDIPSGISSDTGQIMGEAVRADLTVTFGLPKVGHLLYPGAEHTGRLFIEDIGFPESLLTGDELITETIERDAISMIIPERHRYSHKGDFGHVLIVAGSRGKTGAAMLTARACLRAGAGLVTIGVPESLATVFQTRVREEMVLPLPDAGTGVLSADACEAVLEFLDSRADILAIGPGITSCSDTEELLACLLERVTVPMVIDADGLNAIGARRELFSKVKAPVVLTPHPGEMAVLLQPVSAPQRTASGIRAVVSEIERDRIGIARSFASETGTCLVLKGAPTVVAAPEGHILVNTTGNAGMATAGSGDVLTGVIAALLGQGLDPMGAAAAAVYLHGLAGDAAASKLGMHSLIASDLIERLPDAFRCLSDA